MDQSLSDNSELFSLTRKLWECIENCENNSRDHIFFHRCWIPEIACYYTPAVFGYIFFTTPHLFVGVGRLYILLVTLAIMTLMMTINEA